MDCWNILALAPTTDLRSIKKAYAKQLKQIDQETDPQAFIALRDAYEHAQYLARYILTSDDDENSDDDEDNDDEVYADQEASSPNYNFGADQGLIEDLSENQNHSLDEDQDLSENQIAQHAKQIENIEYSYQQFEQQLQEQNQQFHLYEALAEIQAQLEALDPSIGVEYVQRFSALLERYNLDSFKSQLKISATIQQDVEQTDVFNAPISDTEASETSFTDAEFSQGDDGNHDSNIYEENFNAKNANEERIHTENLNGQNFNERNLNEQSLDEQNLNHDFINPDTDTSRQFYQALEQNIDAIEARDFSPNQFQRFEQLIHQVNEYSFEQQLELKERMIYSFAEIDATQYQEDFAPFILLWQQYFPTEDDCLNQDYYAEQVQLLVEFYQKQDLIYQHLQPSSQQAYLHLTENRQFQPWQMLLLNGELNKQFPSRHYLDELQIADRDRNANFLYLNDVRHWRQALWMIIVLFVASTYYVNYHIHASALIKALMLLFCIVWYLFIQSPIKARLLSHPEHTTIQLRLSQLWFFSGIALIMSTPFLLNSVHQSMAMLWLLVTLVLFSMASAIVPSAVKMLFLYPRKIVADPWIMAIASMLFAVIFWAVITHEFQPELLLSMGFIAIPVGFLLFPAFFQPLFQSFEFRRNAVFNTADAPKPTTARSKPRTYFNILIIGFWLFVIGFHVLKAPALSPDLLLAIGCYLSLFLLAGKPSTLYYFYKYLCYISLLIATAVTIILPILGLYYLFYSAREDIREYKAHRHQPN
ncbi:Uncharacterized membrane protein YfcA [Acinetobacter marinus]|uniref:Uncharacterized membrane protein YfcA n=1 Tax=Acinetobacter marinus TaxID=281375 RepID=A0A1G6GXV3_9GAMM|nr:sulfite exporter TauE/SafE family protein [Acinetobacter marinus]SDB86857.1 Uncharacterized membrane protein YfcA [Acinetobacter marinus]